MRGCQPITREFILEMPIFRIASSEDDLIISWVEMERELENIESRPRRPLTETYVSASEFCIRVNYVNGFQLKVS